MTLGIVRWMVSQWVSIVSIIISVVALVFSIRASKLPYKKSLRLYLKGNFRGDSFDSFNIIAVNSGNREIFIDFLGVVEGRGDHPKELLEYWYTKDDTNGIKPGEKFIKGYSASYYNDLYNKITDLDKVFICAKDSEGERYFQKIKLEKEPKL